MKKIDLRLLERLRKLRFRKKLKRKHFSKKPRGFILRNSPPVFIQNIAPKNFSFVNNPDEMLNYFKKGKNIILTKKSVLFSLFDITNLTPCGIALLASYFTDRGYSNGIRLRGTPPLEKNLAEMFGGSGFYDYVLSKYKPEKADNNILVHKISKKKVDTLSAKMATDFASRYNFNGRKIFRPIYEIVIELMANTNNHASPIRSGIYEWWLYVFYDKKTNITSYSFLDFGVGIFKSKAFLKYLNLFIVTLDYEKSPHDMAKDLLEGKINSKTGLGERGRGFTCITNHADKPEFTKFIIISNNVYIDVKTKQSKALNIPFGGTFVYWEIGNNV